MKKSFEEVFKEVFADTVAIAKAKQDMLNKVEEVATGRTGGQGKQEKFRSTETELYSRK
jgi:Txe/YoeB family toxin of Txe-Axe toxin-antitoxin module